VVENSDKKIIYVARGTALAFNTNKEEESAVAEYDKKPNKNTQTNPSR